MRDFILYDRTEVWTWTEPAGAEPQGSGQGSRFPGLNLEVHVRVLTKTSRTWTKPDRGQSKMHCHADRPLVNACNLANGSMSASHSMVFAFLLL